jgi:hypothetical protein
MKILVVDMKRNLMLKRLKKMFGKDLSFMHGRLSVDTIKGCISIGSLRSMDQSIIILISLKSNNG